MSSVQWPTSLRELDLFAQCSDQELEAASSLMTRTEIAPGQTFIREGHLGREAVIIADGVARVTRAGREVAAVGRGDVVGEMAILNGGARTATVTALTSLAAYVCTPAELAALRSVAPSVDRTIRERAAARAQANARARRPVGRGRPGRSSLVQWRLVALPGRGTTFACDRPGPSPDAPTLIMLHGLSATGALNWGPSLVALGDRFRVIALDHRGHGRGIASDEPFTLEDCADDAVALADVLGVDRAIFVGYSMGGPIAQLVWRRHPHRVQGLVLCATSADFRPGPDRWAVLRALEEVHRSTRLVPGPVRVQGARALLAGFVVDAERRQGLLDALGGHDPAAVQEAARAVLSFSSTDWIGEVSVPTAVVVTEKDRLVPAARQRELAASIPAAEVVRLDGSHMVFLTQPDALALAVREACRLVSAAAPLTPPAPPAPVWGWRSAAATRSAGARGWRRRRPPRA